VISLVFQGNGGREENDDWGTKVIAIPKSEYAEIQVSNRARPGATNTWPERCTGTLTGVEGALRFRGRQIEQSRSEKECHQPIPAENPSQLIEAEEGNQHDEQQRRETQNRLPGTTKRSDALVKRFAMKHAHRGVFGNFETSKHDAEGEGFCDCWIKQRRVVELVGQMQMLGNEHNFGEGKGVEKGESVERKIDVVFGKNHAFVDDKQREYEKKVS
jgi:hypothetical protein